MTDSPNEAWQALSVIFGIVLLISCTGPDVHVEQPVEPYTVSESNLADVLEPELEDVPYFKAIAEDQEKQLGLCNDEQACQRTHFLRGVAALYENRELAALHFRKVVTSAPNSLFATESRFWLWFLEVLNSPNNAGLTSYELMRRMTREMVSKELSIHELMRQLEDIPEDEGLRNELAAQDEVVIRQKQAITTLTNQLEQAKKDQAFVQDVQQELKLSEAKVKELMQQLEALRRIDQEIREKVPPTRPSENMTPSPEVENPLENQEAVPQASQP